MKLHFWYSQQQAEITLRTHQALNTCLVVVNGEPIEVTYTECHELRSSEHDRRFSDTVYLGYGIICRISKPRNTREELNLEGDD